MKKSFLLILFTICLPLLPLYAQLPAAADTGLLKKVLPPIQKFFVGNSLDGAIFSSGTIQNTSTSPLGVTSTNNSLATLRFSLVVNFGFTFNFNLNRHLGLYTGIDIKNIGFIEKDVDGNTLKRRTYNVGVPVGIKIGNMAQNRAYVFFGGGIDVPINYKEKSYVIRSGKTKSNEWFGNQTPAYMPYVFAGFAIKRGVTFKLQYYPNNFLNPNYVKNGAKPYAGMDVHLFLCSLGFNIRYGKHPDLVEKHVADLKTM